SLVLCLVAVGGVCSPPAGSSVFTYRRIFKSSTPEFIEIRINEDSDRGSYEIRQLEDDPGATPFEVSHPLRAKIFELTVKLNYTVNPDATQLLQICEGLARQQELIDLLQRRMKYDRLGVNDALLQLDADLS